MESGKEIIFADEYGMWMLPIFEQNCLRAYLYSSANILTPQAFVDTVMPLIIRDRATSCCNGVQNFALRVSNKEQTALLEKAIMRKN